MFKSSERPKGYRFPKSIISYAVYLYHRFCYRIETCGSCCSGGALTSAMKQFVFGVRSLALIWLKRRGTANPDTAGPGI